VNRKDRFDVLDQFGHANGAGWATYPLKKYLFEIDVRSKDGSEELLGLSKERGVFLRNEQSQRASVANTYAGYKVVRKGDLISNKMQGWNGVFGITPCDGIVSPDYATYRFREGCSPSFVERIIRSPLYAGEFLCRSRGIGTGFLRLNPEAFLSCPVVVPTEALQERLTQTLDDEITRIDALIEKKTRFIELLKEKRQALITQAVTKGLNPTVPMKDSGVEWIGEVPAHWIVPRLRWQTAIQSGIPLGGKIPVGHTRELPYLRVANVQDGHFNLETVHTITIEQRQVDRYLLRVGDVLMNEGGDNDKLGRGAVWSGEIEPCLHQNHVFAVRPCSKLMPEWLALCSQSLAAKAHFRIHAKQSTNLASISSTNIKELQITMPPKEEQAAILSQLELDTRRLDTLLDATDRSIDLLKERRSALITAAVTGQIDLREEE
jgi:type I restriction enzyme S subunit